MSSTIPPNTPFDNENQSTGNASGKTSKTSQRAEELEASRSGPIPLQEESRSGPIPLQAEPAPPQPYPLEALGPILEAVAKRTQDVIMAADSICGTSFLLAAAMMVQAHANVKHFSFDVPLSLFGFSIARTGDRKSAVDAVATKPLEDRQMKLLDVYNENVKKYKNVHDLWEREREKALRSENAEAEVASLKDEPTKPLEPVLICADPTLEGIYRALRDGQPSIGLFSGEGASFLGGFSMQKDSRARTSASLSALWEGKAPSSPRQGDGHNIDLRGKRFSMHLMVQPIVFDQLVQKERIFREQGLLSRCLLCWPNPVEIKPFSKVDIFETQEIMEYLTRSKALLSREYPIAEEGGNRLAPPHLRLSEEAACEWLIFYGKLNGTKNGRGELTERYDPIHGLTSKAPDIVLRIAGVIKIFHDPESCEIDIITMKRAVTLMLWYLEEALRIESIGQMDEEMVMAKKKLDWMRRVAVEKGQRSFVFRDLQRGGPNPREPVALRKALKTLVDFGHLKFFSERWELA